MNISHVNKIIRQVSFLIVLVLLGALIFKELRFFLGGALGAFTFYVLLRHPFLYLTESRHWNKSATALLLVLLLVIFLLLFGGGAFEMVLNKISNLHKVSIQEELRALGLKIKNLTGFEVFSDKMLEQLQQNIIEKSSILLNTAYSFVANLAMMIFFLYFMLVNQRKLETNIKRVMPFKPDTLKILIKEVQSMIVSNAVGIPAIMIAQGMVASLGYWIFGISDPLFWGIITGFFSIIPIIGTTAIWGVLGVYLLVTGNIWQGIGLLIYGGVIVGSMDNVVRALLGKIMADIHPLVTILGVIMGLSLFGFWGIIFGPLLINLFFLLFKIYRTEYLHEKEFTAKPDNEGNG